MENYYIKFCLDDTLNVRKIHEIPKDNKLVIVHYEDDFGDFCIVVWSYLGSTLTLEEAKDIADDYLDEIKHKHKFIKCEYINNGNFHK